MGRAGRRGRSGAAQTQPSAAPAGGTKADAIREVAQGMPKPVRPRDVIAALAAKGVEVSYAQVGQVLKGMGMKRRGRRGGRKSVAVETVASTLTLESLIAAKRLVDQLGGVEAAKTAVDALAKLG